MSQIRMSYLRIETNLTNDKIPENFLQKASIILGKMLEKQCCIATYLIPNLSILFDDTFDPSAIVFFSTPTKLDSQDTVKYSAVLYRFIFQNLGIPYERVFVIFNSVDPANWAYKGSTVLEMSGYNVAK